jgi:hypothetical protein
MGSVEHIALGQENIGGQQHCFELMPWLVFKELH